MSLFFLEILNEFSFLAFLTSFLSTLMLSSSNSSFNKNFRPLPPTFNCNIAHNSLSINLSTLTNELKDHTSLLQRCIDKLPKEGGNVFLKGSFYVSTLSLSSKANVKIILDGKIISINSQSTLTKESQYPSKNPLILIKDSSSVSLTGGHYFSKYHEAIIIFNSNKINISKTDINGENLSADYDGIYVNNSKNLIFSDNIIRSISVKPDKGYGKGNGITLYHTYTTEIKKNTIFNNGGNGVYVGSGKFTSIIDNNIYFNSMSGIQFNFNLFPEYPNYYFTIQDNYVHHNRADGVDLNNTGSFYNVYGVLQNNKFERNGWNHNMVTSDGSGIGTYIGIGDVKIINNSSSDSARFGLYIDKCMSILATKNFIHKSLNSSPDNAIFVSESSKVKLYDNIIKFPLFVNKAVPIKILNNNRDVSLFNNIYK